MSLIVFTLALTWCAGANAQRAASAIAVVANGAVVSIMVTDGGQGYVAAPAVTLVGGGGTGATAVARVLNGSVSDIVIQTFGSGYAATPVAAIEPPLAPLAPAALTISLIPELVITRQAWAAQQV